MNPTSKSKTEKCLTGYSISTSGAIGDTDIHSRINSLWRCVFTHVWHVSFMCVMTHACVTLVIYAYAWHDLFVCGLMYSWCVSTHMWHDSSMRDTSHSCVCVTWIVHVWHDVWMVRLHSDVTWLIHAWRDSFMRDMTYSSCFSNHMRHDSFMRDMTQSCVCVTRSISVWYDVGMVCLHLYVTWLIHVCYMTSSYETRRLRMWHVAFICVICLIRVWSGASPGGHEKCKVRTCCCHLRPLIGVTQHLRSSNPCHWSHSHVTWLILVWHDLFICVVSHSCVTWLVHVWNDSFLRDMSHSYVTKRIYFWHDSFICDVTHSYVTWLIHMWHDSFICDMTHLYVGYTVTWLMHMWHASFICDMTRYS